MADPFVDGKSVICAEWLNEAEGIIAALCRASTKEEIQICLDMLTSSQLAQTYLALDGSNRMTDQLSLQGDAPIEDWHAAPKSWIDAQISAVNQLIGFARRDEIQVGHGFTAGQPVYWDGIEWQLALAVGLESAGTHVVAFVADEDNFQVAQFGWIENLPAATLTPGAISYVSSTVAGELTLTEPDFSNPILLGITDTIGWVMSQRAIPSGGLGFAIQSDYDTGEVGKSVDPALGNVNYLTKSLGGDNGQDQIVQLPITLNELKDTDVQGATNTITLRTSITPAEVPTLVEGEAELNIPDEILHVGDNVGGTIPFNKNPVAAPVEHADTLNRDASDSHPIVAITGLQNDLDGRYTSAEVDGLIAGLQSQIDAQQDTIDNQQDTIDLQPILVQEIDVAGLDFQTTPIIIDLEPGLLYQLKVNIRSAVSDQGFDIHLGTATEFKTSANHRYTWEGYRGTPAGHQGASGSDGTEIMGGFLFTIGSANIIDILPPADGQLIHTPVYNAIWGRTTNSGYLNRHYWGQYYNSDDEGQILTRVRLTGSGGMTANPPTAGYIQVYKMPRLP